jgi:hypothetical protein
MLPTKTIRWAILDRRFPNDIAQMVTNSLRIFLVAPSLYDRPGLQGPIKQAELVVKLGYWLALGQLQEQEFRTWADRIPTKDNDGWDVDIFHSAPGSRFRSILKMGPLVSHPESCLVQEPSEHLPIP